MDVKKIQHHFNVIKNHFDVIEKCIKIIDEELKNNPHIAVNVGHSSQNVSLKVNGQQIMKPRESAPQQTFEAALKIVNDPNWPEAVPSDLLADVDLPEDLMARAVGILEATVDRNLEGLSFLDFGCGDGYVIPAALDKGASEAVGYDIKRFRNWDSISTPGAFYTTELEDLEPAGYDVIFLYDVLDHAEKPQEVLHQVAKFLAPNGLVYIRCHPWTSRHGGHLYRTLNKAYIHMAVDEVHLKKMGYKLEPIKKVLRPLKHYKEMIHGAGFKIIRDDVVPNTLENYFRNNDQVKRSIYRHWDAERLKSPPLDDQKISHILEIEFVDMVVQHSGIY